MLSWSGSISMRADSLSKRWCQRSAEPSHRGTGCGVMMSSLSKPPRSNKTLYENLFCQYKCKKATSICLHNQRSRAFHVCSLHEIHLAVLILHLKHARKESMFLRIVIFLEVYSLSLLICIYSTKRSCLQKGAAPSQGLQNGMLEPGHDPHPFQRYPPTIPNPISFCKGTASPSPGAATSIKTPSGTSECRLVRWDREVQAHGGQKELTWSFVWPWGTGMHWEHLQYVVLKMSKNI